MKKNIIEIKRLTKRYGIQYALSQIDLEIEQGEVYGIIGGSGAGKSTLFRCLTALESLTEGSIVIDGQDIAGHSKEALRTLRKSVGMVFQHFNLFSARTVLENVCFPLEIAAVPKEKRRGKAQELLNIVGLLEKKDAYPFQLSGGEKQRVAIARALSTEPKILLCDEATSALDPSTTRQILTLLRHLNRNMQLTLVMITHEMQVVKEMCTSAAILSFGKVVEKGKVCDLFARPHHALTKQLLGTLPHSLDSLPLLEGGNVWRLFFRGESSNKPIISQLIKQFNIEVNILLGAIDILVTGRVGNLLIQVQGSERELAHARAFVEKEGVYVEVVQK